jgi:hypothetical protein
MKGTQELSGLIKNILDTFSQSLSLIGDKGSLGDVDTLMPQLNLTKEVGP